MWLILLLGLFAVLYLWSYKRFNFFKNHGIAQETGYFPFGSSVSWKMITGRQALNNLTEDIYNSNPNAALVGYYGTFGSPTLLIKDVELAKRVLIKDFDHFVDRRGGSLDYEANKYLLNMLLTMRGKKWKTVRNMVSPIFTSGKLKTMVPVMNKVAGDLNKHIDGLVAKGEPIDAKALFTSYTMEAIAITGFGVEANAWNDKDNMFRKMTNRLVGGGDEKLAGTLMMLKFFIAMVAPMVAKLLRLSLLDAKAMNFFANIIKASIVQRKQSGIRKNDFVDLLQDEITSWENTQHKLEVCKENGNKEVVQFTKDELETILISQILILFFAGFDTVSLTLSLVVYNLAHNPDVEERVYEEIKSKIDENNNSSELPYDLLVSLNYTDAVINESLRIYPLGALERSCVKDYHIPDSNFTVPKGMTVQVASTSFMVDKKYFETGQKFDPTNFTDLTNDKFMFMAFGQGPRNCIGMRLAYIKMKIALVNLISRYRIVKCNKTVDKLETDPLNGSGMPKGGIWIKLEKRD